VDAIERLAVYDFACEQKEAAYCTVLEQQDVTAQAQCDLFATCFLQLDRMLRDTQEASASVIKRRPRQKNGHFPVL
jgi:hypothetical protein